MVKLIGNEGLGKNIRSRRTYHLNIITTNKAW